MSDQAERAVITPAYKRYVLGLLLVVYAFNYLDRIILATLGEAIKTELVLSDLQLGLLGGVAFALFYSTLGIPIARLAERYSRARIIWIAIAGWSAATALCGFAQHYWQLLIARMGVGVGEGGYAPSVVSLISDYFPAGQRASAYSIIILGLPVGSMIGAATGGWVAEHYGWRMAFIVVGLPGLLLAAVVAKTLREPPRGYADKAIDSGEAPSLPSVIATLVAKRSFIHLTLGAALVGLVSYGMNFFIMPYLIRTTGLSTAAASGVFGLILGVGLGVGTLGGGLLSDWLGRRDLRWYARLPAILLIVSWIVYVLAFQQANWVVAAVLVTIASFAFYAFLPSTQMTCQGLVPPRMRASTSAIHGLFGSLIGLGVGPTLVGWASDLFTHAQFAGDYVALCGATPAPEWQARCTAASGEGLRRALMLSSLGLPWAALHFALAVRDIRKDAFSLVPAQA
jgi:predicted MFS family arabinose efflux permease